MKKILFALPLCLAITLTSTAQRGMPQGMQKLLNAEYAIASLYVDTVNEDKLIEESWRSHCRASSAVWASSST